MIWSVLSAFVAEYLPLFLKAVAALGPCFAWMILVNIKELHGASVVLGFGLSVFWMIGMFHILLPNPRPGK